MKIVITRLIVAGLIAVSIGFSLFYFLRAPQPAISTYYQLSNLFTQDEYINFDEKLNTMNTNYVLGASINSTFTLVKQALDNDFYYYNSYLLFVQNVSQTEQTKMNQKISSYKLSLQETYRLLNHFNQLYSASSEQNRAGMHQNFINAYKVQISRYLELIETLKNYVISYAFNSTTPVGLKQTLLQVQLDYAKAIINSNYSYLYLISELNEIKNKYTDFLNAPQGEREGANLFVFAYSNISSLVLQEYIESSSKLAYVQSSSDSYVGIIYAFLTLASYN